jgi:DNA-binding MarR family transcriptional regulator
MLSRQFWVIHHSFCKKDRKIVDIMGAFHISKTTVHRRITKLIADGWIEVHGSGRSTNYALSNVSKSSGGKKEER